MTRFVIPGGGRGALRHAARSAMLVATLTILVSCKNPSGSGDPLDAPASPQASAVPAPLASPPLSTAAPSAPTAAQADAAPPPVPMRPDTPAPPDSFARDVSGYTIHATLHPIDPPPVPHVAETSSAGMEAARKRTEAHLAIDLAPLRARFAIVGRGFVLPEGAEIRARADRYGHVVILPGEPVYRVAAAGTLRALFGERRLDVAPIATLDVTSTSDGAPRLGYRTRRIDVTSRAGRATFELARIADAGEGGPLLCRVLLDMMSAPPSTALCATDEVPLHAELRWATHGGILFDAVSIVRRLDLGPSQLATPPANLGYTGGALPPVVSDVLLTPAEISALRNGPEKEPRGTLTLTNTSDELAFVWLDGSPIAWVAPGARADVSGLYRGHYAVEWRTFLNDQRGPGIGPPRTVTVPGASDSSGADGGS